MHLAVDDAGQDVQALAIHGLGGGKTADIPYPYNAAFGDGQIAGPYPIMINKSSPH